MAIEDYANFKKYNKKDWIGLTKDEIKEKIKEIFGDDSVHYTFEDEFRETEEYNCNFITFIVVDNKVVDSMWG